MCVFFRSPPFAEALGTRGLSIGPWGLRIAWKASRRNLCFEGGLCSLEGTRLRTDPPSSSMSLGVRSEEYAVADAAHEDDAAAAATASVSVSARRKQMRKTQLDNPWWQPAASTPNSISTFATSHLEARSNRSNSRATERITARSLPILSEMKNRTNTLRASIMRRHCGSVQFRFPIRLG